MVTVHVPLTASEAFVRQCGHPSADQALLPHPGTGHPQPGMRFPGHGTAGQFDSGADILILMLVFLFPGAGVHICKYP